MKNVIKLCPVCCKNQPDETHTTCIVKHKLCRGTFVHTTCMLYELSVFILDLPPQDVLQDLQLVYCAMPSY